MVSHSILITVYDFTFFTLDCSYVLSSIIFPAIMFISLSSHLRIDFILTLSWILFSSFDSGVAGVTFGIDDIYDDKAESSYSTGRSHVQKNNYAQQNGGSRKSKSPVKKAEKESRPNAGKVEKTEGPKKLLGGWEDQGALRIAWDDDF